MNKIKCPNCHTEIDVTQALSQDKINELRKEMNDKWKKLQEDHAQEQNKLNKERERLLIEKQNQEFEIKKIIDQKIKIEQQKILEESRAQAKLEHEELLQTLRKELDEKQQETKQLLKVQTELESIKREKETLEERYKLDAERRISEQLKHDRLLITQELEEKNILKQKELEKQINDQNKLIDEMKRKAEQGSMQLQGEVLELLIEEEIKTLFPVDIISEVKKGVYGSDLKLTVRNEFLKECGNIIIECKNTKDWQNKWIEKLNHDKNQANADVAMLITRDFPRAKENFMIENGIYVCSFTHWKPVLQTLRNSILQLHEVSESQVNKGEKMEILYNYLKSNQFKIQIENIVSAFSAMRESLEKEKRSIQKTWAEREKQIDKISESTIQIYGSIKGIAGNAIDNIQQLELDE